MKNKSIEINGVRYTVSTERVKGKVKCLCMVDDEMYGEEFDYDGRFDHMSDKELEESGLMEETYQIISQEKIGKQRYTITIHIKDNETGKTADIAINNETPEKLVKGIEKTALAATHMMNMSDEDLKSVGEMIKKEFDEKKSN